MKFIIIISIVLCAHMTLAEDVTPQGVHPTCEKIKFMSNDINHFQKAYGETYKRIASQSFEYALMASNVYENYDSTNPKFDIPDWEQAGEKRNNWKGFGAHVYVSTKGEQRVVIAFEGTDPSSIADWVFGNLNIYWKGQYADAESLVKQVAKEYPNAKIITTGHSLGGGLAIHAALHKSNVKAFAFNSSPRIFMPSNFTNNGSEVILISENQDVLEVLRNKWPSINKINVSGPFNKFDFLSLASNNNDKTVEHGMYAIARGIMLVAAGNGNEKAKHILREIVEGELSCPGSQ